MTEFKVQPKSVRTRVNCLSGLFISVDNPHGLTPTECSLVAALLFLLPTREEITREVKVQLANLTNTKVQVITNYINKFKEKKVVIDNKLHQVFYITKITIENG